MSRFLETICIRDSHPAHLSWHQQRIEATLRHFYPAATEEARAFDIAEILSSCSIPENGLYKCRMLYDLHSIAVEFNVYTGQPVHSLQLTEVPPTFDYAFKFADRSVIEVLYANRKNGDDILLTKDGWVLDTSMANIAFRIRQTWYTPFIPLLAGTTWKRLVSSGVLIPRPVHQRDVWKFEAFKIFNAMNDFFEVAETAIGGETFHGLNREG